MKYQLVKQVKNDETLRKSFIDLAIRVFDFSFQDWYENGFWTDKYIPYALISDNRVVANASVNIMDMVWNGAFKRYIQIGTVMTSPEYRNNGLSAQLIKQIISDWENKCDSIYLFANSTVLNFYPKFGFIPEREYQYTMSVLPRKSDFVKLDMSSMKSRELLKSCYRKSNPFSVLNMIDNYELLMFYCGGALRDCVYYSEKLDTVCIVVQENGESCCLDIFGSPNCTLESIISRVAIPTAKSVALGFTPKNAMGYTCRLKIDDDDTLFILKDKENIFSDKKVIFPTLSHA